MLTAKGTKPICNAQQVYQSTHTYGAFSPLNGSSFVLELPECNTEMFQIFLDLLSLENPDEFKIIGLDNAAFHKAKKLKIPENIELIFLPPYSPELNPAEKIWWSWKRNFSNQIFKTLDELSKFIEQQVRELTPEIVKSTTSYEYIFLKPIWTII